MGRHCQKCHHLESDSRFRKRNPKNPATTKHFCPPGNKKHSFTACPTHYEAGHEEEVAEIKKQQRMQKRQASQASKDATKDADKQQKQQERTKKKADADRKKAGVQKLRDRRLARKLPEFKEFLRQSGICSEASPNYLAQLMAVLRRYVEQLQNELHPSNERKRKRNEEIEPYSFAQVVNEIYGDGDEEPARKRGRIEDDNDDERSVSAEEEPENMLVNNNRPPTQPPDPEAQDLEFETAESDSDEAETNVNTTNTAAPSNNNNNNNDCNDDDDYEPLLVRLQNAHRDNSSRILNVHDLNPVKFMALQSYLGSLRNEASDDESE